MKRIVLSLTISGVSISLILLLSSLSSPIVAEKDLVGAWAYGSDDNRTVMICTDKVFAVANYDLAGKRFISSYGGTWKLDEGYLLKTIEWDSRDSAQVGKETKQQIKIEQGKLVIKETSESWSQLDDGRPGALKGAWIITGNYVDDKVTKRASPFYPRRTMKLLSGKYFQWIAYNVATKNFVNAGGGTYTTENGKYTEHIEFFTKTPESIGKTLVFDYSIENGDWRHRGQKSTGGSMDECWTPREKLEQQ